MKSLVLLQEGKLVFGTLLKQNDKQRTANLGFVSLIGGRGWAEVQSTFLQIQAVVWALQIPPKAGLNF